jgi:hypothetical protein
VTSDYILGPSRRSIEAQEKSTDEEWVRVEGKPYLWREIHTNRLKYVPPLEPTYSWAFIGGKP